ncbi:MAG: hypothetical protein FWC40_03555 [Proteobacteria bacterium]|nr:hypothetical protein [Pseudomonadota bacterium]
MEWTRDFEKAPKVLSKMKGSEILFAEDAEGKMLFVYAAMEGDEPFLRDKVAALRQQPEGMRHIVRALNNFSRIAHQGSLCFAKVVFEALHEADAALRCEKCIFLLNAVHENLREPFDWLSDGAESLLDPSQAQTPQYYALWESWCRAILRSRADSETLISRLGPKRAHALSRSATQQHLAIVNDPQEHWERRASAAYWLLRSGGMPLRHAQTFLDDAYAAFPLEALEGIEALSIAVETQAAQSAESDVIAEKLARIRSEGLFLRDMQESTFLRAAEKLLSTQSKLPETAVQLALSLASKDQADRLLATTLLDDARRADFIHLARKYRCLKHLSALFFANFQHHNPLIREFSQAIVISLLENENAHARMAEGWLECLEKENCDALALQAKEWHAFCLS